MEREADPARRAGAVGLVTSWRGGLARGGSPRTVDGGDVGDTGVGGEAVDVVGVSDADLPVGKRGGDLRQIMQPSQNRARAAACVVVREVARRSHDAGVA